MTFKRAYLTAGFGLLLCLFTHPAARSAEEPVTAPQSVIAVQPLESVPAGEQPLSLYGCYWMWHPGDNATVAAPTIHVIFTGTIALPENDRIARGEFLLHADDLFTLMVNGQPAGQGGLNGLIPNPEKQPEPKEETAPPSLPLPVNADITSLLKPGINQVSIRVINTMPSTPAGLAGRWRVRMTSGAVITGEVDRNWKARRNISKITVSAEPLVAFGQAPWNRVPASIPGPGPFLGVWTHPSPDPEVQAWLVVDTACDNMSVTVNDSDAIPVGQNLFRADITSLARNGENRVRIEPCAPAHVHVELIKKAEDTVSPTGSETDAASAH
ncbi:MAG TPA: hypothetical protein PLO53_06210 [Candidatus Hydrogenedentes bacterium]|nr:hypothetical protein [Candidatus Hydrogenedentota bacterium]HPU97535.1 hypothetical protein [Candidatus Hydrogenedentota bacterium]